MRKNVVRLVTLHDSKMFLRFLIIFAAFCAFARCDGDNNRRQDLRMLAPKMNADALTRALEQFVNDELLLKDIEQLFSKLDYEVEPRDELLQQIVNALDDRVNDVYRAINDNRDTLLRGFAAEPVDQSPLRARNECCRLPTSTMSYSQLHGTWVNRSFACDILQPSTAKFYFYPPKEFVASENVNVHVGNLKHTIAMRNNGLHTSGIRWQYFVSLHGVHLEYPEHRFDDAFSACVQQERSIHRSQFMHAALPYAKRIVIIADHGNALNQRQLQIVRSAVQAIVDTLSPIDHVALVGIHQNSTNVLKPPTCNSYALLNEETLFQSATAEFRQRAGDFVQTWAHAKGAATNHSVAFERAFSLLSAEDERARVLHKRHHPHTTYSEPATFIFYISKGVLSTLSDAAHVMNTIARQRQATQLANVQINTVTLLHDGKLPLWETIFLGDVAAANFDKYAERFDHATREELNKNANDFEMIAGRTIVVNTSDVYAALTLQNLYSCLKKRDNSMNEKYHNRFVAALLCRSHKITYKIYHSEAGVDVTLPQTSPFTAQQRKTPMISLSTPVWRKNYFIGVTGVDMDFGEVLAAAMKDFADLNDDQIRVMITDKRGRILTHPALTMPMSRTLYIADVEYWPQKYAEQLLSQFVSATGDIKEMTVIVERYNNTHSVVYRWAQLKQLPLYAVVAHEQAGTSDANAVLMQLQDNERTFFRLPVTSTKPTASRCGNIQHCLYHNSVHELVKASRTSQKTEICAQVQQPVSYAHGSILLSPLSFSAAYSTERARMSLSENWREHWTYLSDVNNLIQNTGLRDSVKIETCTLCTMVNHWRRLHRVSTHADKLVRRYITLADSTTLVYPAQTLRTDLKPTESDWYKGAMRNSSRLFVSKPRIDESGAGYVVSLSQAIVTRENVVVGVAGIDIPSSFLYSLMLNALSDCRRQNKRCILFDSAAYVLARGDPLLTSNALELNNTIAEQLSPGNNAGNEPPEGQHLAHLEPSLMVALLQERNVIEKRLCRRPDSNTVLRFYAVNETCLADAYTIYGKTPDGCAHIQLSMLPRTNIHLATINHACNSLHTAQLSAAFCPCSVADTRCLLCTRVDATECECPCQCAASTPGSSAQCTPSVYMPTCVDMRSSTPTWLSPTSLLTINERANYFDDCHKMSCNQRLAIDNCAGVVGCEWCVRDADGRTAIRRPFCTTIDHCFNGMRGRRASLGSSLATNGRLIIDRDADSTLNSLNAIGTPLGPVTAAIIVIFVILVAAVYAYRHQVNRIVSGRFGQTQSAARLHLFAMSASDDNQNYHFDADGLGRGGADGALAVDNQVLLASFERDAPPAGPSRARVAHTATSSDHGYSTMNPEDASDRGTTIEPLNRPSQRPRPKSLIHPSPYAQSSFIEKPPRPRLRADVIREQDAGDSSSSFVRSSSASSIYSATTASSHPNAKNDITLTTLVADESVNDLNSHQTLLPNDNTAQSITVTAQVHSPPVI